MSKERENIKEQRKALFQEGNMFSKKYLIYSAIFIAVLTLLAFLNIDMFREQVNNATFVWDEVKTEHHKRAEQENEAKD